MESISVAVFIRRFHEFFDNRIPSCSCPIQLVVLDWILATVLGRSRSLRCELSLLVQKQVSFLIILMVSYLLIAYDMMPPETQLIFIIVDLPLKPDTALLSHLP